MADCNIVVHAAALKRIDTCESEVYECMETNIIGTANVAKLCNEYHIEHAIFVSTDKACSPISAYGCAKAFSEHLWIQSNNYGCCKFTVLRYGNVKGSRGSLHALWETMVDEELSVTHPDMTRFFWTIADAAQFIVWAIHNGESGVIYIPKMRGYKIMDIAREYSDKIKIVGLRTNEKLHEELVSASEVSTAMDQGERYAIYPVKHEWTRELKQKGTPLKFPVKSCDGLTSDSCLSNEGREP
jgi:FlaA1/EpsC-like NDP-sugar epimerase